ncbi:VCBS repeat-containing protein [Dechloromonas denitrificans]|uniref:VCBS repeat-containing protein n=1 Tax=Dechloromonas denitrificans TaxID=281362 RepID=UPI001CF8FF9E|nr:VCBS repeat-containing protein [Dechloromonas denitrificans]UCV02830.1 VCBS repeat-containing protein [Dechloromonas denitrificans]
MKIASANLQMASAHTSLQRHEVKESLKMWVGQRRPDFAGDGAAGRRPQLDSVTLSEAGKAAQSAEATKDAQDAAVDNDPKMILIRSMLEKMLGHKIHLFDAAELQARMDRVGSEASQAATPSQPSAAGFGVEHDRHESYTEAEQTSFAASGTVKTADGREISFQLELSMARAYYEESDVSIRLGDAARKTDPLVLNFAGTAAQLTDQRFAFDLNSDGRDEQINFVAPGSGFLAFDRNQDGKVNNGSELFGPATNDGFAELAALDDDKNGWIDENDAAFNKLQVWTRDASGKDELQSLTAAGVGAIALSRIATPFDLKTNANELLGQIRTSGIFLQEDGAAGTIQQIDLTA